MKSTTKKEESVKALAASARGAVARGVSRDSFGGRILSTSLEVLEEAASSGQVESPLLEEEIRAVLIEARARPGWASLDLDQSEEGVDDEAEALEGAVVSAADPLPPLVILEIDNEESAEARKLQAFVDKMDGEGWPITHRVFAAADVTAIEITAAEARANEQKVAKALVAGRGGWGGPSCGWGEPPPHEPVVPLELIEPRGIHTALRKGVEGSWSCLLWPLVQIARFDAWALFCADLKSCVAEGSPWLESFRRICVAEDAPHDRAARAAFSDGVCLDWQAVLDLEAATTRRRYAYRTIFEAFALCLKHDPDTLRSLGTTLETLGKAR